MWARFAGVILGFVVSGPVVYELALVERGVVSFPVTVIIRPADGRPVRQVYYTGLLQPPTKAHELDNYKCFDAQLRRATALKTNTFTIQVRGASRRSPFRIARDSYIQELFVLIRVDLEDGRKIMRVEPTPPRGQPRVITLDIPAATP